MQQPFPFQDAGRPPKPAHGFAPGNTLPYPAPFERPPPRPNGQPEPWWWKPQKPGPAWNAPVAYGGATTTPGNPYGGQQGNSPFGAKPQYGYQPGPTITPGGPPARPIEEHPIYGPPGWNPLLGREENLGNQKLQQLIAQRQSAYGDKLSKAGIPGGYSFSVGNAPGRVQAYQTAPPQSPYMTPRYILGPAPAGMPYGATSPGAMPSNQGYTTQGQGYSQQISQQSNPSYYSQQISQQNPMMPQLLALLQQLQGSQQRPQGF